MSSSLGKTSAKAQKTASEDLDQAAKQPLEMKRGILPSLSTWILINHIHTSGAPCHPSAFLQTLKLALPRVLGLALHVVIVVVAAPRSDEEGSGHQRRRAGAELLDLRDRLRERSRIVEVVLVEPDCSVNEDL